MGLSVNFAPLTTLIRATLNGSQVGENELAAYDCACDYYTKERVALQKTVLPVEFVDTRVLIGTTLDHIRAAAIDTAHLMEYLSIPKVNELLMDENPDSSKSLFIHWPEVTISNEKDESIDIKDLFCRIPLFFKGMSFRESESLTFMKTTYTKVQWDCSYLHSHTQTIGRNPFVFKHFCLGTGPIKNTISTLKRNSSDPMAMALFFWELDKIAHVESLSGIPYNRLSTVTQNESFVEVTFASRSNSLHTYLRGSTGYARDFMSSFFKAVSLPFGFRDGKYVLGCPFTDFIITVSNYYKKWKDAVQEAARLGLRVPENYSTYSLPLVKYIIKDGKLFTLQGTRRRSIPAPSSLPTFKFNDKVFTLTIEDETLEQENYMVCTLLEVGFVASLLEFILTSINTATSKPYEEKRKTKEEDYQREQFFSLVSAGNIPASPIFAESTSTSY